MPQASIEGMTDYLNLYQMNEKELCIRVMQDILDSTGITATAGIGTVRLEVIKVGTRVKMSREMRAKQFQPFAALKGYSEALRRKEKIVVPKMDFSEEYQEELDRKLRQIHRNDMVTVIYFCKGEYLKVTGMVTRFDPTARLISVVDTKIPIGDIYDITKKNSSYIQR